MVIVFFNIKNRNYISLLKYRIKRESVSPHLANLLFIDIPTIFY